MFEKENANMQ